MKEELGGWRETQVARANPEFKHYRHNIMPANSHRFARAGRSSAGTGASSSLPLLETCPEAGTYSHQTSHPPSLFFPTPAGLYLIRRCATGTVGGRRRNGAGGCCLWCCVRCQEQQQQQRHQERQPASLRPSTLAFPPRQKRQHFVLSSPVCGEWREGVA